MNQPKAPTSAQIWAKTQVPPSERDTVDLRPRPPEHSAFWGPSCDRETGEWFDGEPWEEVSLTALTLMNPGHPVIDVDGVTKTARDALDARLARHAAQTTRRRSRGI